MGIIRTTKIIGESSKRMAHSFYPKYTLPISEKYLVFILTSHKSYEVSVMNLNLKVRNKICLGTQLEIVSAGLNPDLLSSNLCFPPTRR